jgi:hypothetical protein
MSLAKLTVDELALATASAMQVLAEIVVALGADPRAITDLAERKAQELVVDQGQSNAGNMLRVMLGERIPD